MFQPINIFLVQPYVIVIYCVFRPQIHKLQQLLSRSNESSQDAIDAKRGFKVSLTALVETVDDITALTRQLLVQPTESKTPVDGNDLVFSNDAFKCYNDMPAIKAKSEPTLPRDPDLTIIPPSERESAP